MGPKKKFSLNNSGVVFLVSGQLNPTKWMNKCYLSSQDKQCRTQNHFCAHQGIWVSYLALEKGNSSFEIGNVYDHGNFVLIR